MKRFNLLVVNGNSKSRIDYLKELGKVGRRNRVFEVESVEEAETLIDRLTIDLVLVDLDQRGVNWNAFHKRRPDLFLIGATDKLASHDFPAFPDRFKVFLKSEINTALVAELKTMRKGQPVKYSSWLTFPSRSSDFKNFNQLLVTSN